MTELESKLVDRILEKVDVDKLIERIGLDVLTDRIAERAAEIIVAKEYPSAPAVPESPLSPFIPETARPKPYFPPVTVMYGVTPTEFNPTAIDDLATQSSASTYKTSEFKVDDRP